VLNNGQISPASIDVSYAHLPRAKKYGHPAESRSNIETQKKNLANLLCQQSAEPIWLIRQWECRRSACEQRNSEKETHEYAED
jgi:hypothetical protein